MLLLFALEMTKQWRTRIKCHDEAFTCAADESDDMRGAMAASSGTALIATLTAAAGPLPSVASCNARAAQKSIRFGIPSTNYNVAQGKGHIKKIKIKMYPMIELRKLRISLKYKAFI